MKYQSHLKSHPNKLLAEHLIEVTNLSRVFLREKRINLVNDTDADKIVTINGIAHDLGKATKFFQGYLKANDSDKERLKKNNHTHHGLFSAICGYFIAQEVFKGTEECDLYPLICFSVIRRHHGNLGDIMNETIIADEDITVFSQQISAIDGNEFDQMVVDLKNTTNGWLFSYDELKALPKLIQNENLRRKARSIRKKRDLSIYLLVNFFYSILIDADKSEVTIGRKTFTAIKREVLAENAVDIFKEKKSFKTGFLNKLREDAYREVNDKNFKELKPDIYALNLPTGLGKTLSILSFALRLKDSLFNNVDINYRIIYSLPFLSIIDQNYQVVQDILNASNISVDTSKLLKHHYLTKKSYKVREAEFEPDIEKIMVEGWNSEIIVTTFVQLFHTLISARNKSLRKFHRIANSIIILDEVQAVRHQLWPLIKEVLKLLVNKLNCYIIFVTATDPLIVPREEVKQLVNREEYFGVLNRVKVKVDLKGISLEELVKIDIASNKSYLFIFNTIDAAREFYNMFSERYDVEVVFLSSHITPKERLQRINRIKSGKVRFAITTQLVEAGVDIDFNVVYRDLAPLDSINQAAGRCNRNGNKPGEFHIVKLLNEKNNKPFYSYIYNPTQVSITEGLLRKNQEYWERDFMGLIDKYYDEIQRKCSFDVSENYIKALYDLRYKQSEIFSEGEDDSVDIDSFSLIKSYPKVDVFIMLDENAEKIWDHYLEIKTIDNIYQKRMAFEEIKAQFYQYVISIPTSVDNIPPEDNGFLFVPKLQLDEFYDMSTGFKVKGCETIW